MPQVWLYAANRGNRPRRGVDAGCAITGGARSSAPGSPRGGSVDEGRVGLLPSRACWQVLAGPTQSWFKAEYWVRRADHSYQFGYLFANLAAVSRQLWWRYPFALSVVTAL